MLNKVNLDSGSLETSSAEEFADLFFEIGHGQNKNMQWTEAVYWLRRAYDVLRSKSQDLLSDDSGELRVRVMHDMARALLKLETDGSQKEAWKIVRELEIDSGDRLVVLLLRLDVLATDISHSVQDYCETIHKIIHTTIHLTDTSIRTIFHHIHKLISQNPLMAHSTLLALLKERLLGTEETKWIEKALITIIWNCTSSTDFLDDLASLSDVFDAFGALANGPTPALGPHATTAAQIVIQIIRKQHLQDSG